MKMYRTKSSSITIEEIEIDKKTDHNVFYTHDSWGKPMQQREALRSSYTNWHESRDAAKMFLLDLLEKRKISLEKGLEGVKNDILILTK